MGVQLTLPGIRIEPTRADIRALVRDRMAGFEFFQRAREQRRKRQQWLQGRDPKGYEPEAVSQ